MPFHGSDVCDVQCYTRKCLLLSCFYSKANMLGIRRVVCVYVCPVTWAKNGSASNGERTFLAPVVV